MNFVKITNPKGLDGPDVRDLRHDMQRAWGYVRANQYAKCLWMARLVPYEIDAAQARGVASKELATLDFLEAMRGDEFTIYHGVHWARVEGGASIYGEIDFIIVDWVGRLLAIEQKNGLIESDGSDLFKAYARGPKSIRAQVNRNIQNLSSEFSKRHDDRRLDIDQLLYCPGDKVLGQAY